MKKAKSVPKRVKVSEREMKKSEKCEKGKMASKGKADFKRSGSKMTPRKA